MPTAARLQRRILLTVALSQAFSGAGLAAGTTVGALLAADLFGTTALAGLPTLIFTLGAAVTAYLSGHAVVRWGRRGGLTLGFALGSAGSFAVAAAAATDGVVLFALALFAYGAGTGTSSLARYAATDLAAPERRASAVGAALVLTTLGALASPALVGPLEAVAAAVGAPTLAGPFLLAGVAFAIAALVLGVGLRPDPYLTARARSRTAPAAAEPSGPAPTTSRGALVGATIMMLSAQVAMIAIMTMTPVHMAAHHHSVAAASLVIALHVSAMFLPSLVTGRIIDRVGLTPMAALAGALLLASGVLVAVAPGDSLPLLIAGLVLLGLGWNIGFIAGTSLLVAATAPERRPIVQGRVDVLVAVSGAGSAAAAGAVVAATNFATLALVGGALALAAIPAALLVRRGRRPESA